MSTVLVVDVEADIRELLRLNLELDGHDVILAADGNEAIEFAVGEHPDCVVLDVMMPEKDGWEVLAEVKASIAPSIPWSHSVANVPKSASKIVSANITSASPSPIASRVSAMAWACPRISGCTTKRVGTL